MVLLDLVEVCEEDFLYKGICAEAGPGIVKKFKVPRR